MGEKSVMLNVKGLMDGVSVATCRIYYGLARFPEQTSFR